MSQGMVPVVLFSAYDVRVISLPDKSVSPTQLKFPKTILLQLQKHSGQSVSKSWHLYIL